MKESQHVEWKASWRDEYLKWISGFANSGGGVLIIGKDDEGKVVGVPDAKRLLVDIPNKVVTVLGIVVDVNLKGRAGKEYLQIVDHWVTALAGGKYPDASLERMHMAALLWALERGSRSGRVAHQFARDWAGRHRHVVKKVAARKTPRRQ